MDNEIMYIKLDDIIPNRFQPREIFDDEALNKLADSIRQHGVIEPIIVRPVSNKYEIIAGERRYKASVLAGLTKIPAMVRQLDDKESSIVAFIENEHRSDVSAIEEARTMERILKNNNMTQEELGKELGINQSTIANKLRLLNLPLEVQESLMRNEISERHARSLLSVKNEEKQIELLKKIKEKRMTVRELDSEIKDMNDVNYNINDNNMNPVFNSYLNNNDDNLVSKEEPIAQTFNSYLNNNENSMESLPTNSNPQEGFVSFLNDFKPLSQEPITMEKSESNEVNNEIPKEESTIEEPGFMDFLNNYDNNYPIQEETIEQNPVMPSEELPKEEPEFMEFLNNYDNNYPLSNDANEVTTSQPQEDTSMNENISLSSPLNNYENDSFEETPVVVPEEPKTAQEDMGFMNFLNSYENNYPIQEEQVSQPQEESLPIMEQNDYQTKTVLEEAPVMAREEPQPMPEDAGFMNFLNSYDSNSRNEEVKEENVNNGFNESTYNNYTEPTSNVMINNVNPPITADFNNQYVEDNPNYVDVSKQAVIDNIDEIIARLKTVVDDIKNNSKYKIDTDEINYDDIYQITIKIDKRDF